jgi:non-lysosomal glucosylceramidase
MARIMKRPKLVTKYRERFDEGSRGYDDLLWNGDYYIQIYDAEKNPEQNYGKGCHSDQLFGQWWALCLGLGHVLSPQRVRVALDSMVRYNLRDNFEGHKQQPRQFASDDEPGLLVCSWPHGERPSVPTLYSDEVWTGIARTTR